MAQLAAAAWLIGLLAAVYPVLSVLKTKGAAKQNLSTPCDSGFGLSAPLGSRVAISTTEFNLDK